MEDILIITNPFEQKNEVLYVDETLGEKIKEGLGENDTMRQVSQEEFDNYKRQAEVQKEHRELENSIAKYWREIGEYMFDGMYNQLYRPPIPTKEVVMKGFTQIKGRKHLSKKKRKLLKSNSKKS